MDINFRDDHQKAFYLMVLIIFDIQEIPYYPGGSRYFGYYNENSDLDIFITLDYYQQVELEKKLKFQGFIIVPTRYNLYRELGMTQFFHPEHNIQITVMENKFFQENKENHYKIKSRIKADEKIIPILSKMKKRV